MRKLLMLFVCLPMLGLAQTREEDATTIKKIADEILTNGKAYDWLYQLTKQIGGRLAGSPQMVKAENWGKREMEKLGPSQVYFQECIVPHWIRNGADKAVLYSKDGSQLIRKLDALAIGNSLAGQAKAELLVIQDFEDLEKKKALVKGKIIFYNKAFDPTNIQTFRSYGQTSAYRGSGASRAAKYGAVAVLIRSLTESVANDPHTGGMRYQDSFPKIPALAIGPRDADAIWNLAKEGGLQAMVQTHGKFLPDTIGHNVIAEITGTDFPNQYITIGGHLDSWDINEGAHDDGAGVVHTMEVLRTFLSLGIRPKHSIRFVLFANEENGLKGGNQYANEAKEKKETHVFALESDAGGFTPRGFSFEGAPEQLAKLRSWIPYLAPYGVHEITEGGGGADIGPLKTHLGTPIAGLSPDSQRYFDFHHARSDVFENVHKRELLLGAINLAALIYLVDKYGLK